MESTRETADVTDVRAARRIRSRERPCCVAVSNGLRRMTARAEGNGQFRDHSQCQFPLLTHFLARSSAANPTRTAAVRRRQESRLGRLQLGSSFGPSHTAPPAPRRSDSKMTKLDAETHARESQ